MARKNRSRTDSRASIARVTPADFDTAEQLVLLRNANSRLASELARANAHRAEYSEAIVRAVQTASASLVIPPVEYPRPNRAVPGVEEKALVVLSDVQLGKVTASYNSEVAEARVVEYAEKIIGLTDIQRKDHPVREARVYLLGDIVEGELIFPHQPWQVDSSLFRQVAVDGPRILTRFLRTLLTSFEHVHVVGVIGNHGRLGPRRSPYNPETNMDRMLYQIVKDQLAGEPRLSWNIPYEKNERAWYAVDYPFGGLDNFVSDESRRVAAGSPMLAGQHGFLLFHGDQIPGSAAHSTKTIATKIWGWASGAVPEPFNHVLYGHWHNHKFFDMNGTSVWCNGSTESNNVFAQEVLAAMGKPSQLLLFCHPTVGVTAEYRVRLT